MRTPLKNLCPHRPSIAAALLALAGAPAAAQVGTIEIGQTPGGEPIQILALGDSAPDRFGRDRESRPALLIVAGLQGHHAIGRAAAEALAERLPAEHADLLATHTVYILTDANPAGHARWENADAHAESGRAPQPGDADRDGRTDEDPAEDLNGDGLITMMRVPAPSAVARKYRLSPTHLIDPDEPRLMRTPKPEDAEAATHALLIEGIDNDDDGAFNEDGWAGASGGGVDLDRHFPTHWPEHTDGAGLYPLAGPEARALAAWARQRTNIVAVLVYGPHDTLATVPPTGQFPPPGRVPSGIEAEDKPYYGAISERYKEITGATKAADGPDRAGSFLQWSYADLGVFAFGSPVWTRPDLVKQNMAGADQDDAADTTGDTPDAEPADPMQAERDALLARGVPPEIVDFIVMTPAERVAEMASFAERSQEEVAALMAAVEALPAEIRARVMALAQGGADPGPMAGAASTDAPAAAKPAKRGASKNETPDAKWLEWIDAERDGEGFVSWQPFDHPQLGPVEIGGFVPGVRVNPPDDLVADLLNQQTAFVADLLARLPNLGIDQPSIERVGDGLWRIGISARNTGLLPTVPAIGVKAGRVHPLIFALDPEQTIPSARLVGGTRLARFETLPGSGASVHASWLVVAAEGDEIRLEVRSDRFGDRGFDLRLHTEDDRPDQPSTTREGDRR